MNTCYNDGCMNMILSKRKFCCHNCYWVNLRKTPLIENRICKRFDCANILMNKQKNFCSKFCSNEDKKGKSTWNKGLTKFDDDRIKTPWSGGHHTEETKQRISLANKGREAWNKGKTGIYSEEILQKIKEARANQVFSEESKIKKSETMKEFWSNEENKLKMIINNPILQKDKILNEEHRQKIGLGNKGKIHSEEQNLKMSKIRKQIWKNNPKRNKIAKFLRENRNKHFCQCGCNQKIKITKGAYYKIIPKYLVGHNMKGKKNQKISDFQKIYWTGEKRKERSNLYIGKFVGNKNGNWNNGSSFLPYPPEFNKELKDYIKQRDMYMCQTPGCMEIDCLHIHHIDYNKQNNNPENLVTLCRRCHMKTTNTKKREYWINYYFEIVNLYL